MTIVEKRGCSVGIKAKRILKAVAVLAGLLVVLVVLVVCILLFWLGPVVKLAAQNIGSKALGTPLTINELSINPRHGTFHMTGFVIANQNEFGWTNAVSLASMDMAVDIGSLLSSTVVVHRVQIDSPHFVYEQNTAGDNVTRFVQNIEQFLGVDRDAPLPETASESTDEPEEKEPKVVVVEQLQINDIQFLLANTDDPQLDVAVGLDSIDLSMTNGVVNLQRFHVSNPNRLETPNLFTLEEIHLALDPGTIYSDTVSILDLQVKQPYTYLERNAETDTVQELLRIAESFSRYTTNETVAAVQDAPEETGPEPIAQPVALHHLLVDDIQVRLFDTTVPGFADEEHMLAGIGAVTVKLVDGSIQVRGVTVPSPAGYAATNLFQLANIDILLDPNSVFTDQVIITDILVDAPEIHLEQQTHDGNFTELLAELQHFIPSKDTASPAPEAAVPARPVPLDEQPVVLRNLEVTNFLVSLSLPLTTNQASGIGQTLSDLNPIDNLGLDRLNPLSRRADTAATNGTTDAVAPLNLIKFSRLQVQPMEGRVSADGLSIGNTYGFNDENLAVIDHLEVKFDPDTLQQDILVINDILVGAPHVTFERQITTDNIKALQQTIEQALSRREEYVQKEVPEDAGSAEPPAAAQKVIIDHLLVSDGQVRAKLSALPTATIPLPKIELSDVGKDEGGAGLGQAATMIYGAFYDSILMAISGTTGFAVDTLKGAGALTLGTLGMITGIGQDDDDDQVAEEPGPDTAPAVEEAPVQEEPTAPRARSPLNRRRPGRIF